MNKFILFQRKLMSWGNPEALEELIKYGKDMGFWESLGWTKKIQEKGREMK